MIDLLKSITQIFTAFFAVIIPIIANADLGPMGIVLTALALAPIGIKIYKALKK